MQKFIGTGVALITPFNADSSVDFNALERLVLHQIQNGVNYLVVGGTTGEPATLTKSEFDAVKAKVIAVNNNRLPLVLGVGGNNTASIIETLTTSDLSAFDAILSVSPYYNKPTQEGIYQHFKAIATASSLPIIMYNVPGRTASNMQPETVFRLANDFENIIGIKEAGNNMQQYLTLIKNKPDNFLIISGDDDLVIGVTLAGGSGVISVIGQAFPKTFSTMIQLGLKGDSKQAYKLHYELMDMIDLIFKENNPAGIKAVLKQLNISSDQVRLPLVKASESLQSEIAIFLRK